MHKISKRCEILVLGIGHLAAAVRRATHEFRGGTPACDCDCMERLRPVVVACSDFDNPDSFRDANRRALDAGTPILFAWIDADTLRVGPTVVPGQTACFECVPAWPTAWASARSVSARPTGGDRVASHCGLGAQLVASQMGRILLADPGVRACGALRQATTVLELEIPTLQLRWLQFQARRGCSACAVAGQGPGTGF